jgi:tryptophanyl-tRNA synthetase
MSASNENSAIYLTDTPDQIKKKINRYAFSGGGRTMEEQREKGANLEVDVPYQWLRFFMEDDEKLAEIATRYGQGEMLTGEVKKICIDEVTKVVLTHQEARAKVTGDMVKDFMKIRHVA